MMKPPSKLPTVCAKFTMVCGFIKLYKHDFEVMKYIGYVMPTI